MWIFVEGQGTQVNWILPPPQIIVYITELEDSNYVLNILKTQPNHNFMTTQFIQLKLI